MPQSYIEKILRARVYDVARETPLDRATMLSARLDNNVFLKREDLLPAAKPADDGDGAQV